MIRDYDTALQHIRGVVDGEPDLIANLSNIAAILKNLDGFFWVGFYLVKGDELVLGPFQGPVACTRIEFGKGVCGRAWEEKQSQLVPDVHAFEGHIACNPNSKSEVVIPITIGDKIGMVLDVDSDKVDDFSELDLQKLQEVGNIISEL